MVSNLNDKKDKSKFAEFKRSFMLKVKSISMIPFILGKATFLKIYLTYHPDSHIQHNAHPEFKKLLNSFKSNNQINNIGDITRLWSFMLNIKHFNLIN